MARREHALRNGVIRGREVVLLKAEQENHISSFVQPFATISIPGTILKRGLPRGRHLALLLVPEQLAIVERSAKTGGVFAVLAL